VSGGRAPALARKWNQNNTVNARRRSLDRLRLFVRHRFLIFVVSQATLLAQCRACPVTGCCAQAFFLNTLIQFGNFRCVRCPSSSIRCLRSSSQFMTAYCPALRCPGGSSGNARIPDRPTPRRSDHISSIACCFIFKQLVALVQPNQRSRRVRAGLNFLPARG